MAVEPLNVLRTPIILLGMHRSGTSLIARVLDELGLFQGAALQEDHESTWFLEMNDALLRRVNASWDHPDPIRDFLEIPDAFDLTSRCLRADMASRNASGYLGMARYLKYRSVERLDTAWAWKDPRTVFTLPLWLKLFPMAKLIYIVRNGVDVASSLRVRERRELARRAKEFDAKAKKLSSHTLLGRAGFKGSARCLTLEGGFMLWEQYVAEAERHLAAVDNPRMILQYEKFLADPRDPRDGLGAVARFCGLEPMPQSVEDATRQIDAGRSKAFICDPELRAFYEQVRLTPWMQRYGYAALGDGGMIH